MEGKSFAQVKNEAKALWNEALDRIQAGGGSTDQYRTFYSCLYRSLLFPRKFYEFDAAGKPVHYSPYNGQVCDGYLYTDTGFWDTFRALFPLLNPVYPSVNQEIQVGLANIAAENDFLPEWASPGHRGCMVGNNSASVVADAIVKGVTPQDSGRLYMTGWSMPPSMSIQSIILLDDTAMSITMSWAMFHTMSAFTKMWQGLLNMPMTTGACFRLQGSSAVLRKSLTSGKAVHATG